MANLTLTNVRKLHGRVQRMQAATKRAREKAGETTEALLASGVTAGTAFGFGYLDGRYPGKLKLGPVRAELIAASGLHALAMFGVGRGMEPHLRAAGNGALACYTSTVGRGMGIAARTGGGVASQLSGADYNQLPSGAAMLDQNGSLIEELETAY